MSTWSPKSCRPTNGTHYLARLIRPTFSMPMPIPLSRHETCPIEVLEAIVLATTACGERAGSRPQHTALRPMSGMLPASRISAGHVGGLMCGGGTGGMLLRARVSPLSYDGTVTVARRERRPMNRSGWDRSSRAGQRSCWYRLVRAFVAGRCAIGCHGCLTGPYGCSCRRRPSRSKSMRSWTRGESATPRADEHVATRSFLVVSLCTHPNRVGMHASRRVGPLTRSPDRRCASRVCLVQ
jgi:hypothetical protein